jgi:hypothetical protein
VYALKGCTAVDLFSIKEEALFYYFLFKGMGLDVKIETLSWKIAG